MCVCAYICLFVFRPEAINIYIYIHTHICMCVCVCVCVCVCTRARANCFIFEWSVSNYTSSKKLYLLFMRQKDLLGPRPPHCCSV